MTLNGGDISGKVEKLNGVRDALKLEFVGLDDIIDEVCSGIESWYLFPEAQVRPTIINMWGMTGTGKTSLVVRLFQLLGHGSVLKFDVGDWIDDVDSELRRKISAQVRKIHNNSDIPVFVFDEFQLGRTLSKQGDDVDRPGLRVIWDMMDSGKFDIISDNWNITKMVKLHNKLSYCQKNNVTCVAGEVKTGKKLHDGIFVTDDDGPDDDTAAIKRRGMKNPFIPYECYWYIREVSSNKFVSDHDLEQYIVSLGDENSIIRFVNETIVESMKPVVYDFTNSIIFNIGNLDEAYTLSDDNDPDMDPDTLREFTEKISIVDIKDALSSRFRPEQIARLGNTHVIYKSFTGDNYRSLISMELDKVSSTVNEKFGINITFSDSMRGLVYDEGVFPVQGVRPIFSTIKNMVESYIGRIIVGKMKIGNTSADIRWDYVNEKYFIDLGNDDVLWFDVKLKVQNMRKSDNDDKQALVAIHEAGHAVASIYSLGICPKIIMTKTAGSSAGFCHVDMPDFDTRETIINDIITMIGGITAERLIFGENNVTAGSYSDLSAATTLLVKMLKNYGMGDVLLVLEHDQYNDIITQGDIAVETEKGDKIFEMMSDLSFKCNSILTKNKRLLLELGKYLTENSKIMEEDIKKLVSEHGSVEPVYRDPKNYYDFKSIVCKKIDELIEYGK